MTKKEIGYYIYKIVSTIFTIFFTVYLYSLFIEYSFKDSIKQNYIIKK